MSVVPRRHLVRLALPPGIPPLALLRTQLASCLPELDEEQLADIQLVATELVTNAYLHGQPPVEFALLELGEPAAGGRLRLEVSDKGAGRPAPRRPSASESHGRGLLLVGASTARWGVTETAPGKTVWAEFAPLAEH